MRKRGLAFILSVTAVIALVFLLISDRLIEWGMERAGSAIVGARVEFEGVDFRIFSLSLSWDRLRVTNPQSTLRNMIETGFVDFDLSWEPLLLRRFVIQNMQADSVRFNTERDTDGALAGTGATSPGTVGRVQELVYDELENLPSYRIANLEEINVDSIMRIFSLRTPSVIDSLQRETDSIRQYWQDRFADLPSAQRIEQLENQLQSIQPDELESTEEIREAVRTVQSIARQLDSLQGELDQAANRFGSDIQTVSGYDEVISQSVSGDVQKAARIADVPQVTAAEMTRAIFGPEIANNLLGILNIIGAARYYGSKVQGEEPPLREDPPRLAGQTIRYTGARDWPKLWIQNISLSAVIADVFGEGAVQNVSSYQRLIGEPITFAISGAQGGRVMGLDGLFDYVGEIPKDSIRLNVAGVPLEGRDITDSEVFPFFIEEGSGSVSGALSFVGEQFLTRAQFEGSGVLFAPEEIGDEAGEQLQSLEQRMLESVPAISVGFVSEFVEDRFLLNLSSNIGGLVADAAGQVFGEEIARFGNEVSSRINMQVEENRSDLQNQIEQLDEMEESFDARQQQLEAVRELVREKLDALGEKAGEGLFERFGL
ncbi:MAG: TIGR03545 family protein [Chitinispirillaceae bacterium]